MLKGRWASLAGVAGIVAVLVPAACSGGDGDVAELSGHGGQIGSGTAVGDGEVAFSGVGDYPGSDVVVWSWGHGRTMPPSGEFVDIAANELMSCGVRVSGELVCWGQVEGELPEGEFTEVVLSGGAEGAAASGCALGVEGAIECWVDPRWDRHYSVRPDAPSGVFVDIGAGIANWCAVDSGGAVVCWGRGFDGVEQFAESGFSRVFLDEASWDGYPVCALDADGGLLCWGDALAGVPSGSFADVEVSAGRLCGIGLAERRLACWDLADGEPIDSHVAPGRYSQFVAGPRWGCALRQSGPIECGSGAPEGAFIRVAAAGQHACGIRDDRTVVCWGSDSESAMAE